MVSLAKSFNDKIMPITDNNSSKNGNEGNIFKEPQQVVIVDDESTGRLILGKIVQQVANKIVVTEFDNPKDALDWLDSNHVDLIITDYRMPDMNGVDFIKKIREKEKCYDVPIVMVTVVSEIKVRYDALDAGATAFLTRPIDQVECRTSCRNLLKLHEQHFLIHDRANWLTKQVDLVTKQIALREKETLLRLAKAVEYRDEGTGNHDIRLAKYSRQIAEELGLGKEECDDIEIASPMHDIGKIGIPDHVLLKPGKLNEEEWKIMQTHTLIGHGILADSQSKYMKLGAIIALYHHERFDGTGYPEGLEGTSIPLVARIVAVADVFDALISVRPYKEAWPMDKAIEYLQQQAGIQLDPHCVDAFCTRIPAIKQTMLMHNITANT